MSPTRSSRRINEKRRFLLTGFSPEDREQISASIKKLGGDVIDQRAYDDKCSHVLCVRPNRSEKFLGACATGKWILKREYLDACVRKGAWADETDFEWTEKDAGDMKHNFLFKAPRRWRLYVKSSKKLAFSDWRVILIIDDANLKLVFKRLLEIGGAEAVITRLPPSVDTNITHIFVKTNSLLATWKDYLKPWKDKGVPCIAPDYIGDYLVEDTIPPLCSRDIFLKDEAKSDKSSGSGETAGDKHQKGKDNLKRVKSSLGKGEGSLKEVKDNLVKGKSHLEKVEWDLKKVEGDLTKSPTGPASSDPSVDGAPDKSIPRLNKAVVRIQRLDTTVSPAKSLKPLDTTVSPAKSLKPLDTVVSPMKSLKPLDTTVSLAKSLKPLDTIVSPAKSLKRQISHEANHPTLPKRPRLYEDIRISSGQHCLLHHQPASPLRLPMSLCMMEMFNTCYDDEFYDKALEIFLRYISMEKYPTPEMLSKVISMLYASTSEDFSQSLLASLLHLLAVHPPLNPALSACYLNALQNDGSDPWEFISSLLDRCKGLADVDSPDNSLLILDFVTRMFRLNLLYVEDDDNASQKHPILSSILWSGSEVGVINFKVRHLMSLFVDACKEESEFRRLLYSLLVTTFRCVQCCTQETHLNTGHSDAFITELTIRLQPVISDLTGLERTLDCVRGTKLCIGVCCATLDSLDNISVDKYHDVSVGKILSHYLFTIPKRDGVTVPQVNQDRRDTKMAGLSKAVLANVNKRNIRGESKLHVACMKGDTTLVRQLLHVSSIDVNLQDYAGWTPLHEAANAGNVECVQLLLDYKPPKTITSYFSPAKTRRGVDLFAVDPEGTTPLHDAVMNHRLKVAKLLVKYGGEKLLHVRNKKGQTALDLALNEDTVEALQLTDENDNMVGQMDWSQLSTQSEDLNERYDQTNADSCVSVLECQRVLLLFECLLTSYIRVHDLGPGRLPHDDLENQNYFKRLPRYVRKLRKHIHRIVVEEGKTLDQFSSIFERLELLAESYV